MCVGVRVFVQVSPTDLHSTGPLSSPSPTTSPDLVTSPPPQAADMSGRKWVGPAGEWKQLLDETSGRFYYYHAPTRTTRWDPPTTSTRSTTPVGSSSSPPTLVQDM